MLGAFGEVPLRSDFETVPELRSAIQDLVSAPTGDNPAAIGPLSAALGYAFDSDEFNQAAEMAGGMIAQPYIDAAAQTVDPFLEQLGAGLTPTPVQMQIPNPLPFGPPFVGGPSLPIGTPPLFQGMPSLSDIGNMLVPQPAADVFTGMMNMPPQPPPPPAFPTNIPPQQLPPQQLPPPAPPMPTNIPPMGGPMGPYQGVGGYPASPGY